MSLRKSLAVALLVAGLVIAADPTVLALPVTFDRIVLQHVMHVVSTEKTEDIGKNLLQLKLKDQSVMPLTELLVKSSQFKDAEGVLFVIDRSKTNHIASVEEALLPCPTSAIDSNGVILYSRKAKNRNAWEIMISAPNQKWLLWELDRICNSNLRNISLDANGSILDKYLVKRLQIVSTEGRDLAAEWVRGQTTAGGDKLDWDFASADSWTTSPGMDTVFLLDSQKLTDKSPVLKSLPAGMRSLLTGENGKSDVAAIKDAGLGSGCASYAIVAPSPRHLRAAVRKYGSLKSIPDSLADSKLRDLTSYSQVAIVVGFGDSPQDLTVMNDLSGKLSSALSANTGFTSSVRQDLKDLVFQSATNQRIGASQLQEIAKNVGKGCAIVVADLTAIDATTSYVANKPACTTSPYAAFTTAEPTKPTAPDSEDSILFKGKKYRIVEGSRKNDPQFINDYRDYRHNLLPKYEEDHKTWDHNKKADEDSRYYHSMDWTRTVDSVQTVKVTGTLRVYDIGSGGQVLFSCSLDGRAEQRNQFKSDQVTIRGEASVPDSMIAPESRAGVDDMGVVSRALEDACSGAADQIKATSLLPTDAPNQDSKAVNKTAEPKLEHVNLYVTGAVKLSAKPSAAGTSIAKDAALQNAYTSLLTSIQSTYPGATFSVEDVKLNTTVMSEGWNAATHEYRVKTSFAADVPVQ